MHLSPSWTIRNIAANPLSSVQVLEESFSLRITQLENMESEQRCLSLEPNEWRPTLFSSHRIMNDIPRFLAS
jgi:hypothetical protein